MILVGSDSEVPHYCLWDWKLLADTFVWLPQCLHIWKWMSLQQDTCSLVPYKPNSFLLSFTSPVDTFVFWIQSLHIFEFATPQSRCRWPVLMTCEKLGWRCEGWDSDRQRTDEADANTSQVRSMWGKVAGRMKSQWEGEGWTKSECL